MEYLISGNGKLRVFRDCPDCEKFLEEHPTLRVRNVLNQKQRKDKTWYHTSYKGRILHKYLKGMDSNE